MAQNPHIIDLRRSYIPMDPNAFPPTMHATEQEDQPEARIPVMPYDGFNFMPTPQGYSSFFGINSLIGIDALTGNVDEIFVIQTDLFANIAVALKDDGIWTKALSSSGAWTHVITLSVPSPGVHKNWSRCVIDQAIYVYRQGEASYWVAKPSNSFVFAPVTPTGINMAGQLGIFKAGGRLGFWDSENSIAWSAFLDHADFVDSLETLSGKTRFQDIVGKIVNVLQHGNGFIIYCTRSIVHVERVVESTFLFRGKTIFTNNGISYRKQVVAGDPDTSHYVMSTTGFCEITNGQVQFSSPEASTYFKESGEPIYLEFINGRYLFFQFIDPLYTVGRVDWEETTPGVETTPLAWTEAVEAEHSPTVSNIQKLVSHEYNHDTIYLAGAVDPAIESYAAATAPAVVPIWNSFLHTRIPLATLIAWRNASDKAAYFDTLGTTNTINIVPYNPFAATVHAMRHIPGTSGNILVDTVIADSLPTQYYTQENNDITFFSKQRFLWDWEDAFITSWKAYIEAKVPHTGVSTPYTPYSQNHTLWDGNPGTPATGFWCSNSATPTLGVVHSYQHPFRNNSANTEAYLDLRLDSSKGNYYGTNAESMWAQRTIGNALRPQALVEYELSGSTQFVREAAWGAMKFRVAPSGIVADGWFASTTANALDAEVAEDYNTGLPVHITAMPVFNSYADLIAGMGTFVSTFTGGSHTCHDAVIVQEIDVNDNVSVYSTDPPPALYQILKCRAVLIQLTISTPGHPFANIYVLYGPTLPAATYQEFGDYAYPNNPALSTTDKDKTLHFGNLVKGQPVYIHQGGTLTETINSPTFVNVDIPTCNWYELGYTKITGHGHYEDAGATFVVDDSTPGDPAFVNECPAAEDNEVPTYNGAPLESEPWLGGTIGGNGGGSIVVGGVTYPDAAEFTDTDPPPPGTGTPVPVHTVTIPGGTTLIQIGSIEPLYPTFKGAFVFDLHYKKWGKMLQDHKNLFDIFPINSMAGEGTFPYAQFLPRMACRLANGTMPLFDQFPVSSEIVFGKIGFYRKGFSNLEEVRAQFRSVMTGQLIIEASDEDGRSIEPTNTITRNYEDSAMVEEGYSSSARWFNVIFKGFFDLIALEARAVRAGRR